MSHRPLLLYLAALGTAFTVLAPRAAADDQAGVTFAWKTPSTEAPRRRTPRLVNYCHISSELAGYRTSELQKMLAQWDVLVLFPYAQVSEQSLVFPDSIRAWNPKVRILAWMPLQGPSGALWQRSIPEASLALWSGHDTNGKIVTAPWGRW